MSQAQVCCGPEKIHAQHNDRQGSMPVYFQAGLSTMVFFL
jgi:hypothetical protein